MAKLGTLAAALALMAGLAGYAGADSDKAKEKGKEATESGSLTDAQLGDMLTRMGYEPKKGTYKSGAAYYDVKLTTQSYEMPVRLGLSPNKRTVWLMANLGELPADVPAEKLRALLQAVNSKTGKMQFRMTGNLLKADQPMDNYGVTPARLKRELEDFAAALQDTGSLWAAPAKEPPKQEAARKEAPKDAPKKEAK